MDNALDGTADICCGCRVRSPVLQGNRCRDSGTLMIFLEPATIKNTVGSAQDSLDRVVSLIAECFVRPDRYVVCPCSLGSVSRSDPGPNGWFNGVTCFVGSDDIWCKEGVFIAVRHSHHDFRRDAVDLATEMQF
jgi:hypothetical protein